MKKIVKNMIIVGLLLGLMINKSYLVNAAEREIYYSNSLGLALSYEEFTYVTQFIDEEELVLFTQDEYEYIVDNIDNDIVETDTKYIKTVTEASGKEERTISEEYISEEEMLDELNVRNVTLKSSASGYSIGSLYSLEDRVDTVQTAMKKIVMNMYSVAPSVKKVSLTCTWLSIPQCKSYDVIAFRTTSKTVVMDSIGTENILGFQYYDGNEIKYTYTSDNLKSTYYGLGLSMNIVDSTSKSLKMKFSVNFGSAEDPYTIYGSYQHATDDLTLAKSKRYTINSSGMGKVIDFWSSVSSSYDNTPGLVVTGSLLDE